MLQNINFMIYLCLVQEEDHAVGRHRWTGSTISDQDNSVINNRMSLEPPLLNSEHFGYHHKSSTFNSLNKTESDCDVDDKASLGDKYLFPYTGIFKNIYYALLL